MRFAVILSSREHTGPHVELLPWRTLRRYRRSQMTHVGSTPSTYGPGHWPSCSGPSADDTIDTRLRMTTHVA